MKQGLTLIVGATGTIGSEVMKLLKEQGLSVRGTTSKTPQSSEFVKVNLATGEGVHDAFSGVEQAFLISPPGYANQYEVLSPLIQEAKRRGLKKVVLMTAMGANAVETAPFRRAELELEKSGLNYNIVRPNWFMQNFNSFWRSGIVEQAKILVPAGSAKTSFIHSQDISEVIAKLLTTDQFVNQAFDLTGPEAVDHSEVAQAISKVTGKKIIYQEIEPKALQAGLLGAGLPSDYVDFMLLIFGFLKEGYNARTTASVAEITGHAPRGVDAYAREHKAAWL